MKLPTIGAFVLAPTILFLLLVTMACTRVERDCMRWDTRVVNECYYMIDANGMGFPICGDQVKKTCLEYTRPYLVHDGKIYDMTERKQ